MSARQKVAAGILVFLILLLVASNVLYVKNMTITSDSWLEGDFGGETRGSETLAIAALIITLVFLIGLVTFFVVLEHDLEESVGYVKAATWLTAFCFLFALPNCMSFSLGDPSNWEVTSIGHPILTGFFVLLSIAVFILLLKTILKLTQFYRLKSEKAGSRRTTFHQENGGIVPITVSGEPAPQAPSVISSVSYLEYANKNPAGLNAIAILVIILGSIAITVTVVARGHIETVGLLLGFLWGAGLIVGGDLLFKRKTAGGIMLLILGSAGFILGAVFLIFIYFIATGHGEPESFYYSLFVLIPTLATAGVAICGVLGMRYCRSFKDDNAEETLSERRAGSW